MDYGRDVFVRVDTLARSPSDDLKVEVCPGFFVSNPKFTPLHFGRGLAIRKPQISSERKSFLSHSSIYCRLQSVQVAHAAYNQSFDPGNYETTHLQSPESQNSNRLIDN